MLKNVYGEGEFIVELVMIFVGFFFFIELIILCWRFYIELDVFKVD